MNQGFPEGGIGRENGFAAPPEFRYKSACCFGAHEAQRTMRNYPAIFFLIALGAAGMGFTGIATSGVETVRSLFVIFLFAAIVSLPMRNRM